jgi:2-iminobutanoate/2-iminopropanoate deaminase
MSLSIVHTEDAPLPASHYSQAIVANGFVFVSGLLPMMATPAREIPHGIRAQAKQVFANLDAIVRASGSDIQHVVNVQIFISDLELWGPVSELYAQVFGEHKPARTIVHCLPLLYNAKLEINAVAILP